MKYIFFLIAVLSGVSMRAQTTTFLHSGTITYERIVNCNAIMERVISADGKRDKATTMARINQIKDKLPQFSKREFKLQFTADKSLYFPIDDSKSEDNVLIGMACNTNKVYTEFGTKKSFTEKSAFGKKYVITDTLRKIKWRFMGETRDIAGYTCYRANGLLADSIYIVVFFCPQIPCASGPESFVGLPGITLGVSIPHEHISWFATKVEATVTSVDKWDLPYDKKTITDIEFRKSMNSFLDNIGENNGGSWFRQFMFY